MILIDELKRQAEKHHNDREQSGQDTSGVHKLRNMKSAAALKELYHYLHEFSELLNQVQPDIRVEIDLGVLGKLTELRQSEYRLFAESSQRKEVVRLVFALQGDNGLELENVDTQDIQKQLDQCKRQGLIVSYISRSPDKISIHGYVPIGIEFYSDFVETNIHVVLQNINQLADQHYLLSSDSINEETLDQLGNFLLRRNNKFMEILVEDTSNISGTFRSGQHQITKHNPQTEQMETSRLRSLFNREQRLYLTYRNKIKDIGARTANFVMGRANDCDLIIDADMASRHHAKIVYRKGKFVLIDQSTNGTFVKHQGGKEVYVQSEEVPLTGSGFISLGKSVTVDNESLVYFSCQ